MKKNIPLIFLFIFSISPLRAAEYRKAAEIIQVEGKFVTTDGSSYFIFRKDGSFASGPLSSSGREIEGQWKALGDHQFVVEGQWGWRNGAGPGLDRRRLVMNIQPPFRKKAGADSLFIPRPEGTPPQVYQCYLTIEELYKIKK